MGDNVKPVEKPGYFAVLPANVRYDTTLRPAAKLLYAEISALCNKYGYCTASNTYFSKLYGTTTRTIEQQIKQLKDSSYIWVEIFRDENNTVLERRMYITDSSEYPPEKKFMTSRNFFQESPEKKFGENNTRNNNNIPPISPTGENPERKKSKLSEPSNVFEEYAGTDTDLLNTLLAFAADRETRKKRMTDNARRLLCRKLDRLASDNAGKIELLEHAIVMGWDSVYPSRDKQLSKPPERPAAPRKECREL